jgi:hypothetical protein
MSLLDIANTDLVNIIAPDFETVTVQVDINATPVEVQALISHIGAGLDPDTGQIIASESFTISFVQQELTDKGITLIADESIVTWKTATFMLSEQMPDKTLLMPKWQGVRYDV